MEKCQLNCDLSLDGRFWYENHNGVIFDGKISYTDDACIVVEITREFYDFQDISGSIIHGVVHVYGNITLVGCKQSRGDSYIYCLYMIIGVHITVEDRYACYIFEPSYFKDFCFFDQSENGFVLSTDDNDPKISFNKKLSNQDVYVEIKYTTGRTIKELLASQMITCICRLLSLLLLRPISPISIYLHCDSTDTKYQILSGLHRIKKINQTYRILDKCFYINADYLYKNNFNNILKKWFNFYNMDRIFVFHVLCEHLKGDWFPPAHLAILISSLEQWRYLIDKQKDKYKGMLEDYGSKPLIDRIEELIPVERKGEPLGHRISRIRGLLLHSPRQPGEGKELNELLMRDLSEVFFSLLIRAMYTHLGLSEYLSLFDSVWNVNKCWEVNQL